MRTLLSGLGALQVLMLVWGEHSQDPPRASTHTSAHTFLCCTSAVHTTSCSHLMFTPHVSTSCFRLMFPPHVLMFPPLTGPAVPRGDAGAAAACGARDHPAARSAEGLLAAGVNREGVNREGVNRGGGVNI